MNIINRPDYTDKVLRLFGKGLIIALTGQRRVGKSFIMKQVINQLSVDDNNNIIYVDKEDELFHSISTHTELTQYVKEHLIADKTNYLFIDEVQNIKEFELTLRSLHSQEACEIVITGSNAKMLSSELSTYLSGRCMEYYIQSLDYTEFLKFHQLPDNDQSLISYLTYGGMPQLYRIGLQEEDLVNDYLQNVYNTIILKDIVEREDIRNSLVQGGLAQSMEKVIENAIYLRLTRLGYNVTVGYLQKTEIDFVATKGDQIIYVQATYLLSNEETASREFGNLALIKDNFPKYVVSMDSLYSGTNFQGIHHMHLRDFLRWKP